MPHRSPVIFWLLLAATICVDAAAFTWAEAVPGISFGFIVFDALALSQISIVCIWFGLRSEKSMWTRVSPFLAVVYATLVFGLFGGAHFIDKVGEEWSVRMWLVLVNQGLHAAILLSMLWLLKRTALWKRRGYSIAEWRFSIADLLVVLTVVAVLGAGMRLTEWYDGLDWGFFVFICGSSVLAVSSVLIWSLWWTHWVLRASGVLGAAIGITAFKLLAEWRFPMEHAVVVAAHYLIQAPVLMVWLAWGPLLPRARSATCEP